MKYQNNKKHPVAFLIAALLACQPITAQAVTFADINQVPWPGAEVSINKAADLGLVVGETKNGKSYFKPKDPVSLAESCQFAYKVLVQTGKATANATVTEKWKTVMNTYKIQSWAHTAVAYCLENSIISISDLSGFVSGEINKSATREQAAEILGRALTVGNPSAKATATSTKFVDNASISADARPYIALLNSEKIVNGDDTNRFNPKKTLNRTETAVMVTNLYSVLQKTPAAPVVTQPTSQSGKISDMTSFYVNLENSASYYLFASNNIPVTLNGETTTISALVSEFKSGSALETTLTLNSSSRVTKMAVTSGDVKEAKETEGKLTDVYYDDDDNDGSIELNNKTKYAIEDADKIIITIGSDSDYELDDLYELFEDLESDEYIEVKVTVNKDGELTKINGKLKGGDNKGDVSGELTDLEYDDDDDSGVIEVDDDEYDIRDVYEIDIELDGEDIDFDDLMDEYEDLDDDEVIEVQLLLDDKDYVIDIEAFTEDYEEEDDKKTGSGEGIIYEIETKNNDEGVLDVDGDEYEVEDIDYVEIDIVDGDDEIDDWDELFAAIEDDKTVEVELTLDKDDYVTEIKGKVTVAKGELKSVSYDDDDDEYTLRVSGEGSADYLFKGDDTKNMIDISSMSVDTMEELYEWMDDYYESSDEIKVTVTLDSNGYVKSIKGSLK